VLCTAQCPQPQSLYAIFDGHAGSEAATFGSAHIAHALVSEPRFASDPEMALKEAVLAIDAGFVRRALREVLSPTS
jgi:protein phosphatase 1E